MQLQGAFLRDVVEFEQNLVQLGLGLRQNLRTKQKFPWNYSKFKI